MPFHTSTLNLIQSRLKNFWGTFVAVAVLYGVFRDRSPTNASTLATNIGMES